MHMEKTYIEIHIKQRTTGEKRPVSRSKTPRDRGGASGGHIPPIGELRLGIFAMLY